MELSKATVAQLKNELKKRESESVESKELKRKIIPLIKKHDKLSSVIKDRCSIFDGKIDIEVSYLWEESNFAYIEDVKVKKINDASLENILKSLSMIDQLKESLHYYLRDGKIILPFHKKLNEEIIDFCKETDEFEKKNKIPKGHLWDIYFN